MRIAYLAESAIPSRAANSIQVMTMCEAFAKLGHEVTLHARVGDEEVPDLHAYYGVEPCFEILRYSRPRFDRRLARIIYGWRLAGSVKSRPLPDLLYGRETYGLFFASRTGRPVVLESHSLPRSRLMRSVQARLSRRPNFARFVLVTELLGEDYGAAFPWLDESRFCVATSGTRLPSQPLEKLERWRQREGALQVGYLGQLFRGKGMEVVVPLARALPEVDVHVAGGTEEDLRKWRAETASIENIEFHGFLQPPETPHFLAAMDILLMPTQRWVGRAGGGGAEARWVSPIKLFEYLASGRPVVASDLPTLQGVLTHEKNALLVPADDIDAWVAAVTRLRDDEVLRRRLADRAVTEVAEKYTWEARARRVLEGISV